MFSFLPLINKVEGLFVRAHQNPAVTISLGCAAVVCAVLVLTDPLEMCLKACRIAQEKDRMCTCIYAIYRYIFNHEMLQK